jgi:tellurite resistance protein
MPKGKVPDTIQKAADAVITTTAIHATVHKAFRSDKRATIAPGTKADEAASMSDSEAADTITPEI